MFDRGKGWLPDNAAIVNEELTSKHISKLPGAIAPVRAGVLNYTRLIDRIPNQRGTSSCVGQALATAIMVTARIAGVQLPRPSPKLIYDFARYADVPYQDLQDVGSRPLAAIDVVSKDGLVAESTWPIVYEYDGNSNINDPPPIGIYQQALPAIVKDYYRIPSGVGASALARHALSSGYAPIFAMPVDDEFERWRGPDVYEGRTGEILGYHMQAIVGFGDSFLLVAGSWGSDWADAGVVALANDYFDGGECTDVIVPTVVPRSIA